MSINPPHQKDQKPVSAPKKKKSTTSLKTHSSTKIEAPPKIKKNVALICVPCSGIIDREEQEIADYINSFVAGVLLRYSRTFDQIRICTQSSMIDTFNYHFSDHHFEFQFRGKNYYYPIDKVTSDPLVIDSHNQISFKQKKCNKNKNFFEYEIKSIKSDNETTLFFLFLDHGNAGSLGRISFYDILKWIDGIEFSHAVIMSDSSTSGTLVDYIRLCDFINSNPDVPKNTIISTGKLNRLVNESRISPIYAMIDLLRNLNIPKLVDYAFDPNPNFYIDSLQRYGKMYDKDIRLIHSLEKKFSGIPDKNILIKDALSHKRIHIDKDLQETLDNYKRNGILTVLDLISAYKIINSLFPKNSDIGSLCIDCSVLLRYLKKYKKNKDKEREEKLTKNEMKTLLINYLDKHIPNYNENISLKFPQLSSYHPSAYDLAERYIPSCINKITVISSASPESYVLYNDYKEFPNSTIQLGSPGAIEFIAALCVENGKLKSIFDRYLNEIKALSIAENERCPQIPQLFSIDPWFYNSSISNSIVFHSTEYSQKFVELLFQVGFTDIDPSLEEEEEEEESEYSQDDPMAKLRAKRAYSIEGYVPKYKESLKLPHFSHPLDRGKRIALEFVHFLNWILAKEGFEEYEFYIKVTPSTPEQMDIIDEYLEFESGIAAGIITLPYFYNIRKSIALYLHEHKNDKKNIDVYDIYEKACYSFNSVIEKYFSHEIKLIFNH